MGPVRPGRHRERRHPGLRRRPGGVDRHAALRVPLSDDEFDAAFERITRAGITYFADPQGRRPGEINHHHGGRGLYFMDPAGHGMEIITRPYEFPEQ